MLFPVFFILFLILIIILIFATVLGSDFAIYESNFILPFDTTTYTITSSYGERIDPISKETKVHNGVDVVPKYE